MEKSDNSQQVFELGQKAYEKGDFKTAIKNFKEASKAGNTRALRFLSFIYFDKEVVIENRGDIVEFLLEMANPVQIDLEAMVLDISSSGTSNFGFQYANASDVSVNDGVKGKVYLLMFRK